MSDSHAEAALPASCGACQTLDRREFLERTLLVAAAGFLAGCVGSPTAATLTPTTVRIADYPALASVGGIAVIDNGRSSGAPVAVARTGEAAFVALSLICPHRGSTVQSLGSSFQCPTHGALFSINGSWTGGQPTSNMSRYNATYDATAGTLAIS
jgi:hypothetical protein